MNNDRSDAAEQLLNYLAYGMTASEALTCFLVNDENVKSGIVKTAAWADGSMRTVHRQSSSPPAGSQIAEDYWQEVLEDTKISLTSMGEIDLAVVHALELEAVSDVLDEDPTEVVSDLSDENLSTILDGGE